MRIKIINFIIYLLLAINYASYYLTYFHISFGILSYNFPGLIPLTGGLLLN